VKSYIIALLQLFKIYDLFSGTPGSFREMLIPFYPLSVTGPQTSSSHAILIKRYIKYYRHNVKSPSGVHGYWNNKVLYSHWPSTSNIKTLVCSKYLRKIYSVSVTVLLHTE
jgi:hypothetical protein